MSSIPPTTFRYAVYSTWTTITGTKNLKGTLLPICCETHIKENTAEMISPELHGDLGYLSKYVMLYVYALCLCFMFMLYALCFTLYVYVLCFMLYALRLCFMLYVYALCFTFMLYALRSCFMLYALRLCFYTHLFHRDKNCVKILCDGHQLAISNEVSSFMSVIYLITFICSWQPQSRHLLYLSWMTEKERY